MAIKGLKKAFANVPLAAGVDTKTDNLQLAVGSLQVCQNAIFTAPGEVQTRFGYESLAETYTQAVLGINASFNAGLNGNGIDFVVLGRSISQYNNELVKTFQHTLSSWSDAENSWVTKGNLESIYVTANPVVRNTYNQTQQDEVVHPNGVQADTWVQNWNDGTTGVWMQFTDVNTGQVLVQAFPVSADGTLATKPKVLAVGPYIVLFWVDYTLSDGDTPLIFMAAWNANLTGVYSTAQITGLSIAGTELNATNPNYDACVLNTPQGELLYLAFINGSDGISIYSFGANATSWTPDTTVVAHSTVVQSQGGIWLCTTSGMTGDGSGGSEGPPSGTGPTYDDGTAVWTYQGVVSSNILTPNKVLFGSDLDVTVLTICGDSPDPTSGLVPQILMPFYSAGGADIRLFYAGTDLSYDHTVTLASSLPAGVVTMTATAVLPPNSDASRNVWVFATFGGQSDAPTGSGSEVGAINIGDGFIIDNQWQLMLGVALAGKAFSTLSYVYVPVAYQSVQQDTELNPQGFNGLQNTYFLVNQNGDTVARLLPGLGAGFPTTNQINGDAGSYPILCEVTSYGNVSGAQGLSVSETGNMLFKMALLQTDLLDSLPFTTIPPNTPSLSPALAYGTYTQQGVTSFEFDFWSQQNSYINATLGQTLIFGGGFPAYYDGQQTSELGFHLYPENIQISTSTSGGTMPADTTYFYSCTYEWTNAQGLIERSAPSIPVSITTGSGSTNSVQLSIPMLRTTAKGPTPGNDYSLNTTPVLINVYRNLGEESGTIFYQNATSAIPSGGATGTNQPITNDPTTNTAATYNDLIPDADMISGEQLYTTGNVIENLPTNPLSDLTVHNNRLFGIDSCNPTTLWFSKQVIPGTPVQMSGYFTFNVDPRGADGGAITAIRELDQVLVVFKTDQIYTVSGIGPDSTGGQGNYQDAQPSTSDVGCIDARSIVLGPNGIYFLSDKGLCHLDRGFNVTYIGAPVEGLVNGNIITSANLVPYTQQVRFTVQPQPIADSINLTSSPSLIMHDYYINAAGSPPGQWGQHTNINAVDACIWQGQYVYMRSNGQVLVETPNLYSDNGNPISLSITSWWVNYSGLSSALNNWCRTWWIYIMSKIVSPCTVTIGLAYDYNSTIVQSVTFPVAPATPFGSVPYGQGDFGGDYPEQQFMIQPTQGLAGSVQITITVNPVVTGLNNLGAGISLSGLGFEYGTSPTMRRVGTRNMFGGNSV